MKARIQLYLAEFGGESLRIIRCRDDRWLVRVGDEGDTLHCAHRSVREPEKLSSEHLTWTPEGIPWHNKTWMDQHSFTLEEITEKLGIEF
jgi:hypothetical protein